jgi:hypothetical protein
MKKPIISIALLTVVVLHCAGETPAMRVNLSSPQDYQVVQRDGRAEGKLVIAGNVAVSPKDASLPDALEVRLTGQSATGELPGDWQALPFDPQVAAFRDTVKVPAGGWYRLDIRAVVKGGAVVSNHVEHVGMGEVCVIAGQSNSANYGEKRQTNSTGMVAAYSGTNWQMAADPEPGAGGTKGSFMALFGDEMVEHFHVPVGIVAMGIGSTSVREWQPAGTHLASLPPLTRNVVTTGPGQWEASGEIFNNFTGRMAQFGPHGFRAVLWHQGESDGHQANPERSLAGEPYRQYLEQLIRESRKTIGWEAPWFVAQVSYHNTNEMSQPDIRAAQKALWDAGVALQGPDTDTLTGEMRERHGKGVHLSDEGLHAHAHLWAEKVTPWLEEQLSGGKGQQAASH